MTDCRPRSYAPLHLCSTSALGAAPVPKHMNGQCKDDNTQETINWQYTTALLKSMTQHMSEGERWATLTPVLLEY